ncbi:restriction endonuclease subunit S [Bacteroides fragilis]|nr:restriction endonuclease subunit S [Bacteroides fragilis]
MADNNENKVLNVPHLRFPEFTEEWEETTLGKISEITKGSGISKDQLSEQGSPCILYGELYTKYKSEIIDEVYSRTELDSSSLVKSKANDVIIPCSGETAIDISTARCVPFNNILLGGDLNIIRLKHDDGGFFAYQLNGARKKDIARVAQGVSVVHLYGENLKHIRVYHPAIEEQKKITRLLSLIDERIATQNKIIEKLQSLIKGLAAQLTQSGTPNIRLCDCLECHSSTLLENCVSVTGSYPVYGATGLIGYTNNYAYNGESILIVKDGSGVGSLSYVNDHFSVIGTLNYLTAKENYSILYLYYALMAFNFTPYITGMAIPHIYFKDYGKAKLFYPSIEKRIRIASLLHNIEQKLVVEQNLVISLSTQKSYLLRMLFI